MAAKLPSCRNWYSSTNTTCDRIQNHGKPQTRFNHFFSPDFTVHKFYVHEIWILGLYERNKFLGLYEQYTIWGLFEFYFLVSGFESDSDLGIRVWIEKKEEEKEKERRKRIGRIKVFMVLLMKMMKEERRRGEKELDFLIIFFNLFFYSSNYTCGIFN